MPSSWAWLAPREPFAALSHLLWLILALPAAYWLIRKAAPARRPVLGLFGFCLAACALASTLFHAVPANHPAYRRFITLDYIGIYLLIAGTYTPIALALIGPRLRAWGLFIVWATAAVGIGLTLTLHELPLLLSTALYLGMGWGSALGGLDVFDRLDRRRLLPLVLGGIFYSLGAVINLASSLAVMPSALPGHGIFHVFVIVASLCHVRFLHESVAWVPCVPKTRPIPALGPHLTRIPSQGRSRSRAAGSSQVPRGSSDDTLAPP